MKTINENRDPGNATRVALLLGLTIGLGIVVHEGFFVVAGAIAVGAMVVAAAHALEEEHQTTRPAHQR